MDIVRYAVLGIGAGGLYGLAALGIVLVHRGSGVTNFAHGAIAAIAAFVYLDLNELTSWHAAVLIPLAVASAGLLGLLIEVAVISRMPRGSALVTAVATLGVLTILQQGAQLIWGTDVRVVRSSLPDHGVDLPFGIWIGADRLWIFGICVCVTTALWAASRHTRWGLAMQASAENQRAAEALGWSPRALSRITWTIGASLAGLAGVLMAPITGLQVGQMTLLVIPALAAALIGSFISFPLALAGGVGIGVTQSLVSRYVEAPGWSTAVPFFIIIGALIARGSRLTARGDIAQHLPALGSGRLRPRVVIGIALAMPAFLVLGFPITWTDAVITTMLIGLLGLSVVVVSGYAGQLSLAQVALAGMGAFIAGRLSVAGAPFELALLAGVLLTIPLGLIVAIPSLRTRGVNLAIATLGLGLVIEVLILQNNDWNGGFAGLRVSSPSLLWLDLDPVSYPERYAGFVFAILLLVCLGIANLRRGSAGRRLVAVRGGERAAASLGVGVLGAKLWAFGISSGIAALAGVLMGFRYRTIPFGNFSVIQSINIVVYSVIGGVGYISGPLIGGAFIPGSPGGLVLDELLSGISRYLPLLAGIALVIILMTMPDGVAHHYARFGRPKRTAEQELATARSPASQRPMLALAVERPPARALEVRSLTVAYGGVVALEEVSLDVRPGGVLGVIGPNGAGKTTLIDAVAGFVAPTSGAIRLGGESIAGWSPTKRARAGIARSYQHLELFEDMSVADNLQTAADVQRWTRYLADMVHPAGGQNRRNVALVAEAFGLESHLDSRPGQLDFATRRLVAIARAVISGPSVLLLDEPAAGLGAAARSDLRQVIRHLAAEWGLGILLIEHDVDFVAQAVDELVVLERGRALESGGPEVVLRSDAVIRSYLGTRAVLKAEPATVSAVVELERSDDPVSD